MKKRLNLLALIAIVIIALSCESQSGKRLEQPMEKVVIIDSKTNPSNPGKALNTDYKVRRIEQGVVTWINFLGGPKFEYGDTILYRFQQ